MSATVAYKDSVLRIPANKHQPDCCDSLVYAWLSQMRESVAAAETWCARANKEKLPSPFYAGHIARHKVIQGVNKLDAVRKANQVALVMGARAAATDDPAMVVAARSLVMASRDTTAALLAKKPEADALTVLRFRRISSVDVDVHTALNAALARTYLRMQFFTLTMRTLRTLHIIAIVSTKSEGIFSPRGYIYYYDPNMGCVVRFGSRDDAVGFIRRIQGDYLGMANFTVLAPM